MVIVDLKLAEGIFDKEVAILLMTHQCDERSEHTSIHFYILLRTCGTPERVQDAVVGVSTDNFCPNV